LIKNHPSVTTLYGEKLDREQVFSKAEQAEFEASYLAELKAELDKSKNTEDVPANDGFQQGIWKDFQAEYSFDVQETRIAEEDVQKIGEVVTNLPEDFAVHPKLRRIISARKKILKQGKGFDWGFAESLSFGSLLLEGHHIRLSGEDCGRGTFSHRHAVWWDVETSEPRSYIPLNAITEEQAKMSIHDSPLSEFSVLGFEYGYSTSLPNVLTIWEGQFGDFVNGAQVIIDQYIVSGEAKWFRASGLVMLLPHGMEGQGPEHSHGYLERFLQLCAEQNIQICNLTTPAQYFHVLRKQVKQPFRKPLIIMAPKSLLRHKLAVSVLSDFTEGQFRMVIDDARPPKKVKRLLLCSGKVYYDLLTRREEQQNDDTAIIRIEQLYPFPKNHLKSILQQYEQAVEVFWVQEETKNRGAWTFIRDQFLDFYDITIAYIGRPTSASPATGSYTEHAEELEYILRKALPKN
jgi:2-oxoglutarate dehydrogenase E1 component